MVELELGISVTCPRKDAVTLGVVDRAHQDFPDGNTPLQVGRVIRGNWGLVGLLLV